MSKIPHPQSAEADFPPLHPPKVAKSRTSSGEGVRGIAVNLRKNCFMNGI